MAKRKAISGDFMQVAKHIADVATGKTEAKPDDGKNPAAVAMGKLGGKVGGKARAASLTPERRAEIAKKAAEKRWGAKDSK